MGILEWMLVVIGVVLGIGSSLFMLISCPVILIWKVYRKVKFGIPIME